jgi:hypothetical protein
MSKRYKGIQQDGSEFHFEAPNLKEAYIIAKELTLKNLMPCRDTDKQETPMGGYEK